MKIRFMITHSEPGGLVEIWNDLAAGLRARGHDAQCLALYPKARHAPSPAGWRHLVARRPGGVLSALRLVLALICFLRRERPDHVVTAMPAANVLLPLADTFALSRTRIVITHHSPTQTHNGLLDRLDGWTGCLHRVTAVVSVSKAVDASLAAKPAAYRAKRKVIGNALPPDVEALIENLRPASNEVVTQGKIVAMGRLSHQKNYPLLIDAMALLPAARLEIIGAGEDEAALRAQARRNGSAERIFFLGHMPRASALSRAARADIFVQVSHYEGHSLALIEAARLGLPLVVSDVPVQVEAITARDGTLCGIVVPLGDPEVLAARIFELMAQRDVHAHWATLARRLGLEVSHERLVDQYEMLLCDRENHA